MSIPTGFCLTKVIGQRHWVCSDVLGCRSLHPLLRWSMEGWAAPGSDILGSSLPSRTHKGALCMPTSCLEGLPRGLGLEDEVCWPQKWGHLRWQMIQTADIYMISDGAQNPLGTPPSTCRCRQGRTCPVSCACSTGPVLLPAPPGSSAATAAAAAPIARWPARTE